MKNQILIPLLAFFIHASVLAESTDIEMRQTRQYQELTQQCLNVPICRKARQEQENLLLQQFQQTETSVKQMEKSLSQLQSKLK